MEREGHMIVLRRSLGLATGALFVAVMAGCQQDSQPSSAPASTTSTVAPTTTEPPVTDAERAWAAGVTKLRERMDQTLFESEVILTQAKLREYIQVGRSCAQRLARLGSPTERLKQAAASAARACRDYARDVLGADRLIAIIDPRNRPSQRVAEKLGLVVERDSDNHGRWRSPQRIYAASLQQR